MLRQRHQKENCQKGWGVIVEYFSTTKRCSIPRRAWVCMCFEKTKFPPNLKLPWLRSLVYLFVWKTHIFSLHHFGRLCPNSIWSLFLCWSDRFAEHSWGSFTSTRLGLSAKKQANETTRFAPRVGPRGHVQGWGFSRLFCSLKSVINLSTSLAKQPTLEKAIYCEILKQAEERVRSLSRLDGSRNWSGRRDHPDEPFKAVVETHIFLSNL